MQLETDIETVDRTMILAGHETVANSLVWGMFELCNHHGVQERLRAEIYEAERDLHQRNESQFSAKDYDSMPYLNAFLKVRSSFT